MSHPSVSEQATRREFLAKTAAASAAALAMSAPRAMAAGSSPPEAKADCCILLWMAGGMRSQREARWRRTGMSGLKLSLSLFDLSE